MFLTFLKSKSVIRKIMKMYVAFLKRSRNEDFSLGIATLQMLGVADGDAVGPAADGGGPLIGLAVGICLF